MKLPLCYFHQINCRGKMRCSETNEGHIVPFQVIKQGPQLKESNGGHIAPPNEGLHAVMTRTDRQTDRQTED